MIKVVHPAYHALPKGGHPSFCPSGNRRLSCVRVLATKSLVINGLIRSEQAYGARTFCRVCDRCKRVRSHLCLQACKEGIPISTAPAVDPAMMDRSALGFNC